MQNDIGKTNKSVMARLKGSKPALAYEPKTITVLKAKYTQK